MVYHQLDVFSIHFRLRLGLSAFLFFSRFFAEVDVGLDGVGFNALEDVEEIPRIFSSTKAL